MGGNMSRDKGQRGEREICKLLQPVVNEVYESKGLLPPVLERNLMQTRNGGFDIAGLDWIALEIKRHETLQIPAWWAQTKEQALVKQRSGGGKGCTAGEPQGQGSRPYERIPVLMYRKNRSPWRVMMYGYLEGLQEPGERGTMVSAPKPGQTPRVRCNVDITMEAFLAWFKMQLKQRIEQGLQPATAA